MFGFHTRVTEQENERETIKQDTKKELDTGQRVMAEQQIAHQEELEQLRARIATLQTSFNDRNKNYLEECNQLKQVKIIFFFFFFFFLMLDIYFLLQTRERAQCAPSSFPFI